MKAYIGVILFARLAFAMDAIKADFRNILTVSIVSNECETIRTALKGSYPHDVTKLLREADKLCKKRISDKIDSEQYVRNMNQIVLKASRLEDLPPVLLKLPYRGADFPSGYRTYSVFIVADDNQMNIPEADLEHMKAALAAFGRAIGPEHIAVFPVTARGNPSTILGRSMCDRFGLEYTSGPYIITTNGPPNKIAGGQQAVIIRLNHVAGNRVSNVLSILERDLRTGHDIRIRTLLFEEITQRVLTTFERNSVVIGQMASILLKAAGK